MTFSNKVWWCILLVPLIFRSYDMLTVKTTGYDDYMFTHPCRLFLSRRIFDPKTEKTIRKNMHLRLFWNERTKVVALATAQKGAIDNRVYFWF